MSVRYARLAQPGLSTKHETAEVLRLIGNALAIYGFNLQLLLTK